MSLAVIAFDFDPYLHLGDGVVRWETLGIAAAIFFGIALAAIGARTMGLRADDLLFVVLGVVPGAVVGGRLGYVFLHPAYFTEHPGAILDPGVGSLELGLAVVGGAITGGIVAALLDGNVGRWFHVSALPVLLVIGAGKLSMVLGGTGQGQPWTGSFATAYLGDGPWGSLAPRCRRIRRRPTRASPRSSSSSCSWASSRCRGCGGRTVARSSSRSGSGPSPGRSSSRRGATR